MTRILFELNLNAKKKMFDEFEERVTKSVSSQIAELKEAGIGIQEMPTAADSPIAVTEEAPFTLHKLPSAIVAAAADKL